MTPGIVKLVGDQDRWQSNLVGNFERALDTKLRRAEAKLLATLSQRLTLDGGRLARSPGNVAAMRWLGPAFERQLSKEGYGTLVTAFVGQFPGQFRFFDETMSLLKLPRIDWAARDRKAFEAQQLTSIEALQGVVRSVGENTKRRALMSVGGLKIDQLAELLHEELGKTLPQATGLADTAMSVFYATVADAGYRRYEDAGVEVRFKYYGPDDRVTRPFCHRLIESGKAYTRDAIGEMDNGQIPNVMVSRGGYRCRHQWILSLGGLLDAAPQDNAPRVAPSNPQAETVAKRVEQALLDVPQTIRKLAAKTPEAKVIKGRPDKASSYDAASATLSISSRADTAEIVHEYFHHIDYSLTREPYKTVSMDGRTGIGEAIEREIQAFGKLGEAGRKALAQRIAGDLNLEDLMEAVSLGEIGQGHGREYYTFVTGSRYREVFANLGSMYSTDRWSRLKSVAPELAAAFEKWLDETVSKR